MAVVSPRLQSQLSDVSEPEDDVALAPAVETTGFSPVLVEFNSLTDAQFLDLLFSGQILPEIGDINPVDRHWLVFLVNILHATLRAQLADDEIPIERQ